jgi:hypothetical protein
MLPAAVGAALAIVVVATPPTAVGAALGIVVVATPPTAVGAALGIVDCYLFLRLSSGKVATFVASICFSGCLRFGFHW